MAGIALENAQLHEEIRMLFDGFVDASVTAIESRDPDHLGPLAPGGDDVGRPGQEGRRGGRRPVRATFTSRRPRSQQIEYAGVLHDFGKVGVREKVLVKAKKLYEEDLRAMKLRFAYIKKALEAELRGTKAACWRWSWTRRELPGAVRADRRGARARRWTRSTRRSRSSAGSTSRPCWIRAVFERLVEIAQLVYMAPDGQLRPYLEPEEVAALQVRRGSLTDVERVEIESHVTHTVNFLAEIPWGRRYADVPRIAGAHHEYDERQRLPRQAGRPPTSPSSRACMTIADIFDALTASDRPYKKAVPVDRALSTSSRAR